MRQIVESNDYMESTSGCPHLRIVIKFVVLSVFPGIEKKRITKIKARLTRAFVALTEEVHPPRRDLSEFISVFDH
jgi:hypothetical protein